MTAGVALEIVGEGVFYLIVDVVFEFAKVIIINDEVIVQDENDELIIQDN